jgi:hypothetical protein
LIFSSTFFRLRLKSSATKKEPPMPLCRLTGSDDSIRDPAATRSAFAAPGRYAQARLALPKHLEHEQKGAALEHRRSRPGTAGPHDNGLAAGEARIERPRFSRLHASIVERQSDWAWQNSFANTQAPCALERTTASRAGVGLSAAKLWFGGIALALLAAGVISAVATVQSGRILRFDAWTRSDLMWLAGVVPDALAPDSRGAYGVAAAPGRELIVAPPAADRAAGEVDAAIASPPDAQPADVEVAISRTDPGERRRRRTGRSRVAHATGGGPGLDRQPFRAPVT